MQQFAQANRLTSNLGWYSLCEVADLGEKILKGGRNPAGWCRIVMIAVLAQMRFDSLFAEMSD